MCRFDPYADYDGGKIIVERSQTRGGRHEIGQPPPVKEHNISFRLPGSNKSITWTSEYGEELGRTNFNLLAVHVLNDTPYLVVSPNLCLSYNKWGRPNPPYVFFKYDGATWQRISLEEFPAEFTTINVAFSTLADEDKLASLGFVTAEKIKELNRGVRQPEYKTILREPLDPKGIVCKEMIRAEDGWLGIDWFSNQPNYEACVKICERQKVSPQNCPCERIYIGVKATHLTN